VDVKSGTPVPVAAEAYEGRYSATGHLLFLRGNNLMAQSFDVAGQRTTGSATVIVENISASPDRYTGQYSLADNGTLVYLPKAGVLARQLTTYGVDGTRIGEIGEPAPFFGEVYISPEGRRAAVPVFDTGGRPAIWIYDLATGVPTRLTFGSLHPDGMTWAPDGKNLAFSSREGTIGIQAATGSAQPRILGEGDSARNLSVTGWSPDGQSLALLQQSVSGLDIVVLPVAGRGTPAPLVDGPGWQLGGTYAPDGQAFAYISNETGTYEVFVMPLPKSGGKLQVTSGGGLLPQWFNGGRELAYVNAEHKLVAVEMTRSGDQLTVGRSRQLFGGRPLPALPGLEGDREGSSPVYITPDGTRVLLAVPTNLDAVTPVTLLTSWKR
jgi:dipeptidyl aminopeptidase/acylaminoacyl peptidase